MVRGEIKIRDGTVVTLERMLDSPRRGIISQVEIPHEGTMVRSRDDPVVSCREGRPLNVDNQPGETVTSKATWRVVGRVQVNDGEAIRARRATSALGEDIESYGEAKDGRMGECAAYDARAMSLPHGDMVADPTLPSTWMVRSWSNVALSDADFMIFPFFGA